MPGTGEGGALCTLGALWRAGRAAGGGGVVSGGSPPEPIPSNPLHASTAQHSAGSITRPGSRRPALCRLFTFSRLHNKGLSAQDVSVMATNVVLSALAIMPYDQVGAGLYDR